MTTNVSGLYIENQYEGRIRRMLHSPDIYQDTVKEARCKDALN